MKPSRICERVRKANMMIIGVRKASGGCTFKTTDAAFKNNKTFWPDNRNETCKSRRVVEGGGIPKQEK